MNYDQADEAVYQADMAAAAEVDAQAQAEAEASAQAEGDAARESEARRAQQDYQDGCARKPADINLPNIGKKIVAVIDNLSLGVFQLSRKLSDLRKEDGEFIDAITIEVATDKTFGNDTARKAEVKRRLALHAGHCQFEDAIRQAEYDLAFANIKLTRAQNEFALHKLERRERIAAVEALA